MLQSVSFSNFVKNRFIKTIAVALLALPFSLRAQESPPGGVSLISGAFPASFNLYSGSASAVCRVKAVTGQPFNIAAELITQKETSNFLSAQYSAPVSQSVKKSGVLLLRFHFLCTSTQSIEGPAWCRLVAKKPLQTDSLAKGALLPFAQVTGWHDRTGRCYLHSMSVDWFRRHPSMGR